MQSGPLGIRQPSVMGTSHIELLKNMLFIASLIELGLTASDYPLIDFVRYGCFLGFVLLTIMFSANLSRNVF